MKLFVIALVFACGCGAKPTPTTTPAPDEANVVLPDVPFDKLEHDQRIAFMKQKVVPAMKPLFQKHDAKDFADFSCVTCHGKQAKEGHFDMPNPDLPKLNFADMSSFKKEDIEWMKNDVWPTMTKILGMEPYSEQNPKGFGCLNCHTQKQ